MPVSLHMNNKNYEALKKLAKKLNLDEAEVLNLSLSLMEIWSDSEGNKLYLKQKGEEKARELKIPSYSSVN